MHQTGSKPFPGFKHVCFLSLRRSGVDEQIRSGLVKFRGQSRKWLFHNLGTYSENLSKVESGELESDAIVGYVIGSDLEKRVKALGQPVLDLYRSAGEPFWQTHAFDHVAVGRLAAEHLLAFNHRNFAFYTHGLAQAEEEMWKGFSEVLSSRAETLFWMARDEAKELRYVLPHKRTEKVEKMYHWFPRMPKPLAVFCHSDDSAATLAELAFFAGVSVPEEMAILGVGNNESVCQMTHPGLSSIALPGEKLGFLLGEHLEAIFEGRERPEPRKLPPVRVVVRPSTDLAAMDDAIVAKALAIMRREAAGRMPVAEIIRQLPVSKRSFNDRFLKAVGRTPREELFRIRLEMAKDRLLKTDQTVLHVSMDCGFADTESMVRLFKETTGLTPTQFRKQNRV
jgi:LacI family transcriptional regulator